MVRTVAAALLVTVAGSATGQAITGFTGGTQFGSYYGGLIDGDVVGFRFTVNQDVLVTDLGVWNGDTQIGLEGLTSDHQIGIWDSSGSLVVNGVAGPGDSVLGQWTYDSVAPTLLSTGMTYTIGALYDAGGVPDGDSYISSATSVSSSADVNWLNSVFPSAEDLGFAFPTEDSASSSGGRFGPNFLYRPVPAPASMALLGLGGVAACRRRR